MSGKAGRGRQVSYQSLRSWWHVSRSTIEPLTEQLAGVSRVAVGAHGLSGSVPPQQQLVPTYPDAMALHAQHCTGEQRILMCLLHAPVESGPALADDLRRLAYREKGL